MPGDGNIDRSINRYGPNNVNKLNTQLFNEGNSLKQSVFSNAYNRAIREDNDGILGNLANLPLDTLAQLFEIMTGPAQSAIGNEMGRRAREGRGEYLTQDYVDSMFNPEEPEGYAAGGMPRSPLMLEEPFIPQRPPRMFINDDRPRFEGDNPRFNIPAPTPGAGVPVRQPFQQAPKPPAGYLESPIPIELYEKPMQSPEQLEQLRRSQFFYDDRPQGIRLPQYIGEGAPGMGMPPEMPQFPGRQPKFPGMMQPIRQPEPVGPLPMMPPVDNQTRTTEQLIQAPLLESELIGETPPPIRTYINEGAPRPEDITEEEILQIDPDFFKQPGDDRGFIPMPLDYGMNNTPTPPRPETLEANPLPLTPDPETPSINDLLSTMPPEVLNPDGTPTWVDPIETAPDGGPPGGPPIEPMPPDVFPGGPEQTAQPTQDQFMERLMQLIQGLQERSQPVAQPAPQPVQQMPPPPPRPPATPFNMGNTGMSGGAPTMPQMFNQGPGFFTPQQRGPRIAPGAIAQQGQEMPNYNLDFSSFLRNR